jgi:hypothetical protein
MKEKRQAILLLYMTEEFPIDGNAFFIQDQRTINIRHKPIPAFSAQPLVGIPRFKLSRDKGQKDMLSDRRRKPVGMPGGFAGRSKVNNGNNGYGGKTHEIFRTKLRKIIGAEQETRRHMVTVTRGQAAEIPKISTRRQRQTTPNLSYRRYT